MLPRPVVVLLAALLPAALIPAQARGSLFDGVVERLQRGYYDRDFAAEVLPALAESYRPSAVAAADAAEERAVVHALLARVPSSHLALLSAATWQQLEGELIGDDRPTFGLQLLELGGRFYADAVLDGGPAARAGLRRGDRVLTIDGRSPGRSRRLDWRADDAALPDLPVHDLLAREGESVLLVVESTADEPREVEVVAAPYSALRASRASIAILEHQGRRFGYLHLWFVFADHAAELLQQTLPRFHGCDGAIVDLRGRGGSGNEVAGMLAALRRCPVPLAALVDERTRSAKEIVAFEFQRQRLGVLVGEPTAGAAVPASFAEVGDGAVLMYPAARLVRYTDFVEGVGVAPDVVAADKLAYANGDDPILRAALQALAQPGDTPR